MMDKPIPTSDEKLMGAVAHLFGPFAATIVWAIQKDKSRFAKFQALQALAFDAVAMVAMIACFACTFGVMFLGMSGLILTGLESSSSSPEEIGVLFAAPFLFPFMIFAAVFPFSLLLLILRLIAAVSILRGRHYYCPVLGNWLQNFLDDRQEDVAETTASG